MFALLIGLFVLWAARAESRTFTDVYHIALPITQEACLWFGGLLIMGKLFAVAFQSVAPWIRTERIPRFSALREVVDQLENFCEADLVGYCLLTLSLFLAPAAEAYKSSGNLVPGMVAIIGSVSLAGIWCFWVTHIVKDEARNLFHSLRDLFKRRSPAYQAP